MMAMKSLSCLEPSTSFDCQSGVLLWGQLDCVLGAKRKLNNNILKFDGIRSKSRVQDDQTLLEYTPIGHRYRCKALKGTWNKYDHELVWMTADNVADASTDSKEGEAPPVRKGKNVFLCHESFTPRQIAEKASTVQFSWSVPQDLTSDVIYVNRSVK